MATQTHPTGPDVATINTYNVDPAHSKVEFKVRHLGFSKVTGRFEKFSATVHVDPSDLSTLQVEATIDTDSINTGDAKRDAHLRSGDFFLIESHPEMSFRSTGPGQVKGDSVKLPGELAIRGTSLPVVLDVEYLGEATDPWGGKRVAFEAKTRINRKDYGLNWNAVLESGGFLVSDEVEIILEVQAVLAN
jgi:polyisoprenoid-binding protein YceI